MEVLSRLPEQLRVAGGDLNEMLSHAKTLNNTPLKEYLDDNLSSLVTVASKYVSQIAAELGRGVFPLITNTASQLFVIFLGLVLATGLPAIIPACTTRSAPSSGRKRRPRTALWWPSFRVRSAATCVAWSSHRSVAVFLPLLVLRSSAIRMQHSCYLYRHYAPGSGCRSLGECGDRHGARLYVQPMLALWTLVVTMVLKTSSIMSFRLRSCRARCRCIPL